MVVFEGLNAFGVHPEILRFGAEIMRLLAKEWRLGPMAREYGVSALDVDALGNVTFSLRSFETAPRRAEVSFPVDGLIRHFAGALPEPDRSTVLERVRRNPRGAGPIPFRCEGARARIASASLVTCPKCRTLVQAPPLEAADDRPERPPCFCCKIRSDPGIFFRHRAEARADGLL